MKKYILMLAALFNTPFSAGVENSGNQFSLPDVIAQARTIKFNKRSSQVAEACCYFGGQNIQSARDVLYARWFLEGQCSIELLYALYISLGDFFLPDEQRFILEDLNGGHTIDNYQFLKAVFADEVNVAGQ